MPDSAEVRCIHDDGMGTLYLATTRHVYRYSVVGHGLKAIATVDHVPTSITLSGSQLYWIADGRVFHITLADTKAGTPVQPAEVAGVQRATSLASRDDGSVWIATQGGKVFCMETQSGNLSEIGYMQSEHNAPLLDIDVDGMGHVWTLSDQQVREFCTQTQARRSFLASAPEIGVAQFSSIETDGTNNLSINGAGALCLVESSPTLNQPAAMVNSHLTAYQIDDDKYYAPTSDGGICLQPDDVELTLYLTTFDHMAANQICFAYRLEGISRDWVQTPVGSNVIHFTKLPVGTYALSVKATDRYGRWGSPVRIVTLRVLPVWYKTWWAQLLFLILLLLLGAGVWKLENRIQLLHRLIRRRESVRLDEIELKREDIMQNRLDDEFLNKAVQSVEAHLADTDFNVEALADAMCMSRANLHRRMKAQTDMSPTDFIRDIRLKKAAHLLLTQPDASITDIATRVGFATPKYFSRLFREKFGVTPKEYTGEDRPTSKSVIPEE
jgi:AraC-like DNA-binding protein